jgi:hypothetical protein
VLIVKGGDKMQSPSTFRGIGSGVVADGIDRGAGLFSSPTDYPPQRHIVALPAFDTYVGLYESDEEKDFSVVGRFWQAYGGGGWSPEWTASEPGLHLDAGRPSAHESDGGLMVAYQAATGAGGYGILVNQFDVNGVGFLGSVKIADNQTFPFLIVVHTSTDNGVTWTDRFVNTGVKDNWAMPSGAADPSNGDLYLAYNHDINHNGTGDVVSQRSTDGGATWTPARLVALGVARGQKVCPSLVVDREHRVHLLFQENLVDTYRGGLVGLNEIGPAGVPACARGHFWGDHWVPE